MTDKPQQRERFEDLLPRPFVGQRVSIPRFVLSEEARLKIERNIECERQVCVTAERYWFK